MGVWALLLFACLAPRGFLLTYAVGGGLTSLHTHPDRLPSGLTLGPQPSLLVAPRPWEGSSSLPLWGGCAGGAA